MGAVDALVTFLAPLLSSAGIDPALILPAVTKYLAGSTAMVGVVMDMTDKHQIGASAINAGAGFLFHPLDLPGLAIFTAAGVRLGRVCFPAVCGAVLGIAVRTVFTALFF